MDDKVRHATEMACLLRVCALTISPQNRSLLSRVSFFITHATHTKALEVFKTLKFTKILPLGFHTQLFTPIFYFQILNCPSDELGSCLLMTLPCKFLLKGVECPSWPSTLFTKARCLCRFKGYPILAINLQQSTNTCSLALVRIVELPGLEPRGTLPESLSINVVRGMPNVSDAFFLGITPFLTFIYS